MEEKKLGLKSVISVSVGLVIATSCLVSLGQGAGTIGVTFIFAMVIKSNWFMYQCRDGACPVSSPQNGILNYCQTVGDGARSVSTTG